MVGLLDLPTEVLLDNLFPVVRNADLLRLIQCNKYLASLGNDDTFWKRKLLQDFNFTGEDTARTSGWKVIYRGLAHPKVFVWGERSKGRLGRLNFPGDFKGGVAFPVEVKIPSARIVRLVAGGMSFHALDSAGNVYVWGTLNGQNVALQSEGYAESGKAAPTPLKLSLPASIRSISAGRLHAAALDSTNRIWNFKSWGCPYKLTAPVLADPADPPIQVDCGWGFTSCLTKSGNVYVWFPFGGALKAIIDTKMSEIEEAREPTAREQNGSIPCAIWNTDFEPVRLPAIPILPDLPEVGQPNSDSDEPDTHLVQIAGMDRIIIGLTNRGHVLKFQQVVDEIAVDRGRWEYLPHFSDLNVLKGHAAFTPENGKPAQVPLPSSLKITHISANYLHFVAYSTGASSIVLIGAADMMDNPQVQPKVIPELQHKDVISVEIGDYHSVALTAHGDLLAWGKFSNGALGLGDPSRIPLGAPGGYVEGGNRRGPPPDVHVPSKVRFDHGSKTPRNRFCISATAAGWHTGALVINLEDEDTEEEEEIVHAPKPPARSNPGGDRRYTTPGFNPFPQFRIGFPGNMQYQGGGPLADQ